MILILITKPGKVLNPIFGFLVVFSHAVRVLCVCDSVLCVGVCVYVCESVCVCV